VCVCDGESEVGGCGDDSLNSITMPNGLLPVLEEERMATYHFYDVEL